MKTLSLPVLQSTSFLLITVIFLTNYRTQAFLNISYDVLDQTNHDLSTKNPYNIQIVELNSTSVNITPHDFKAFSPTLFQETISTIELKISYHINVADALLIKQGRPALCTSDTSNIITNVILSDVNQNTNPIELCKQRMYRFSSYNSTVGDTQTDLSDRCDPKVVYIKNSNDSTKNSVIVTDLLPHQPYKFSYQLIKRESDFIRDVEEEKFLKVVCMSDSAPLHAPQTDIGSFRVSLPPNDIVEVNRAIGKFRNVELYWRPVPIFLVGASDMSYEMTCFNLNTNENSTLQYSDMQTGRTSPGLLLYVDIPYKCDFRSKNHMGYSPDTSHIYIPKQSKIIDTQGKFKLFVAAVSNVDYILEWTSIDQFLPDRGLTKERGGTYTIYWCFVSSPTSGCAYIEGMTKTKDTSFTIEFPKDHNPQHRIFGISYRSAGNKNYTGIIWSECVATAMSQAQSAYDPLKIIFATPLADNHTALSLGWEVKGCKSLVALITCFEVNYCNLGSIDSCQQTMLMSSKDQSEENKEYDFNDYNCTTVRIHNRLIDEVTLTNLDPSTRYAIRMRHAIDNHSSEIYNQWSNTKIAQTAPDNFKMRWCMLKLCLMVIGGPFIIFILIPILCVLNKERWNRLKTLCIRYWRINTTKGQEGFKFDGDDNYSHVGMKYWLERAPNLSDAMAAGSELSLNVHLNKFTLVGQTKDRELKMQQSVYSDDYIPTRNFQCLSNLANVKEDSPDDAKDSNTDSDVNSVTSHDSFLKKILSNASDTIV